ncbi:hypothetical protein JW766_06765 [Candidatus Dojkabacteria bacterium]|nr:hypothetical protein [Candidatus Dojkabacteria bacterium]
MENREPRTTSTRAQRMKYAFLLALAMIATGCSPGVFARETPLPPTIEPGKPSYLRAYPGDSFFWWDPASGWREFKVVNEDTLRDQTSGQEFSSGDCGSQKCWNVDGQPGDELVASVSQPPGAKLSLAITADTALQSAK